MIIVSRNFLEDQKQERERTEARAKAARELEKEEAKFDRKHPELMPRSGDYHYQKRYEETGSYNRGGLDPQSI